MEWSKETEMFIIFMYYFLPAVVIGLIIIGFVILFRNLMKYKSNKK
ncbi:hypothetical protein ACFOST_16210 [Cytobacillus kochii]|nr:hypothetical protein [Cytobacillus kochii]MDQ0185223.1 hypothetical protein [Cytobacillus kochii]